MSKFKLHPVGLALAFALLFTALGAGVALAVQSHMVNARSYLNSALSELNAATVDKGGHRNAAINDVKSAINQVNLGIQYAK
ncbi:MAG TPA: hypothetical protein VFE16_12520 [Candidatus Cybelea sp.]|jgi:hypothetical protein|nr:hypothetical protein [Candidatus Cybelea sp.]